MGYLRMVLHCLLLGSCSYDCRFHFRVCSSPASEEIIYSMTQICWQNPCHQMRGLSGDWISKYSTLLSDRPDFFPASSYEMLVFFGKYNTMIFLHSISCLHKKFSIIFKAKLICLHSSPPQTPSLAHNPHPAITSISSLTKGA